MRNNTVKLYAGTSGFAYPSWKPDFYPKELPSAQFLAYYASRLNLVEINYTYRRLAAASTFQKWVEATPEDFVFAPKAHMKITHSFKLQGAGEFTQVFLESLEPLRRSGRLGPILFQLPPSCKADVDLLGSFLSVLPKEDRYTFEFRHASWFAEPIYALLRESNVALCLAESDSLSTPDVATADFVYLRLRKPQYSDEEQKALAEKMRRFLTDGKSVYALFKHEDTPDGAFCAERLRRQTDQPE